MWRERIEYGDCLAEFTSAAGGFPAALCLRGDAGWEQLAGNGHGWLQIGFPDGGGMEPFCPDGFRPQRRQRDGAVLLDFNDLPWLDHNGRIVPGCRLTLNYEFRPEGAVFVWIAFIADAGEPLELQGCRLVPPMCWPDDYGSDWSLWKHPSGDNGDGDEALIQLLQSVERFIAPGQSRVREGMISPSVRFAMGPGDKRGRSLEWLMEGGNSLGPDPYNSRTSITWTGASPRLEWDFLPRALARPEMAWQWRNRWGWVLCRSPRRRRHLPLRMYHYFDNYRRYPTNKQLEKMALEGADALLIHENWRSDPQNGGNPYDPAEYRRVVDTAHRLGMRVAPYVRGNEISVTEEHCRWFDEYLQRDYDGLYVDYGGPIHHSRRDESISGDRIAFREHFLSMRRLRRLVGEGGILISHTGPFFSTAGLAGLVDGYTSGEGERGIMLADRRTHAFFSATAVAPGAFGTAAFPEYHSAGALPFMAAVGQAPHVVLGTQFVSSSLAHPPEPELAAFARPLWRLWEVAGNRSNPHLLHQENTDCLFFADSPQTGACLIRTEDGLLLIMTNFAGYSRQVHVRLEGDKYGLQPVSGQVWLLRPHEMPPQAGLWNGDFLNPLVELPAYGLAGLWAPVDAALAGERLAAFCRPYPEPDRTAGKYLQRIEDMRHLRFHPLPESKLFMRLTVPPVSIAYEDSLLADLFDIRNDLYLVQPDGAEKLLGCLCMDGLASVPPPGEKQLWPGRFTPWIPLHDLLPPGTHNLEIRAVHAGEPFYSFIAVEMCCRPETKEGLYRLEFYNELDDERSRLSFRVALSGPEQR